MSSSSSNQPDQDPKAKSLNGYRRRLLEHRELDAKLKESMLCVKAAAFACISSTTNFFKKIVRLGLRTLDKEYDKSEDDIKALQSVGQVIGEVLKQLDDERCKYFRKEIREHTKLF
jgi:26S proteasome regulatory subunit T4